MAQKSARFVFWYSIDDIGTIIFLKLVVCRRRSRGHEIAWGKDVQFGLEIKKNLHGSHNDWNKLSAAYIKLSMDGYM